MRRVALVLATFGLALCARGALAQDPAGGSASTLLTRSDSGVSNATPDAGVSSTAPDAGDPSVTALWSPFPDAGTVTAQLPADLNTGSEVAAGVDFAAAGEVVNPDTVKGFALSVREADAVFFTGKTSVAVQFNPYLLGRGSKRVYDEILADRDVLPLRLLQDMAVSVAVSPGTPYPGETFDTGRFATFGYGLTLDVLGARTVYSQTYRDCLFDPGFQALLSEFIRTHTKPPNWDRLQDESDVDYAKRHQSDARLAAYDKAVLEQVGRVRQHVQVCVSRYTANKRRPALFLSFGERFVTPGPAMVETDSMQVQRHFVSVSGVGYLGESFEFVGQVRLVADRAHTGTKLTTWADAAIAAAYSSEMFRLSLEASQSFLFEGSPVASTGVAVRFRFADNWGLQLGLKGKGQYVTDAFTHSGINLALVYEDGEILHFPVPAKLLPK